MTLIPQSQIPTVMVATSRFLITKSGEAGYRSLRSDLAGTDNLRGVRPRGVSLAKSTIGPRRCSLVRADEFAGWHIERYRGLAPSTAKRGASALRTFLRFCVAQRWMEPSVLSGGVPATKSSPPREDWLTPEQVVAIDGLLAVECPSEALPLQAGLAFTTIVESGLRANELCTLRPQALDQRLKCLRILGKGGKSRMVPVADSYIERWARYLADAGVRKWMFPAGEWRFGSDHRENGYLWDPSRHMSQKTLRTLLGRVGELADAAVADGRMDSADRLVGRRSDLMSSGIPMLCGQLIASTLVGGGVGMDIRSLQIAMGHARLDTTAG